MEESINVVVVESAKEPKSRELIKAELHANQMWRDAMKLSTATESRHFRWSTPTLAQKIMDCEEKARIERIDSILYK